MKKILITLVILFALNTEVDSIHLHGRLGSKTGSKTSSRTNSRANMRTFSRAGSRTESHTGTKTRSKAMLRATMKQITSILTIPAQDAKVLEAFDDSYPTSKFEL